MGGEGEEAPIVDRLVVLPAIDHDLHRVVQTAVRNAAEVLECPDVLSQRGREVLRLDEAEIASPRIAEHVAEGVDPLLASHRERDEVGRVVHLPLLAGGGLESLDGVMHRTRADASQEVLDDRVTALEATDPELLQQANPGQVRILLEQTVDVVFEGIKHALALERHWRENQDAVTALLADVGQDTPDGLTRDLELPADAADRAARTTQPDNLVAQLLGHGSLSVVKNSTRLRSATAPALRQSWAKLGSSAARSASVSSETPRPNNQPCIRAS